MRKSVGSERFKVKKNLVCDFFVFKLILICVNPWLNSYYSFNLNILDPILGIVIGIYILIEGFKILKKATLILIESAPEDIDYNLLKKR